MSHPPVPPERTADQARRTGTAIIALALTVAVLSTGAALLVGGTIGAIALTTGITGAGMAVLTGLTLRNATGSIPNPAPNPALNPALDPAQARTVRRVLVALFVAAALCYAGFLVAAFAIGVTAVTFALMLLEAIPTILAAVAAVTGHRALRA